MIKTYRKKPVEVQALQLTPETLKEAVAWCGGQPVEEHDPIYGATYVGMNIPTLEGVMRASEGDYIVKGTRGEFYPVKAELFHDTFEEKR